jgi:hypothetical protein
MSYLTILITILAITQIITQVPALNGTLTACGVPRPTVDSDCLSYSTDENACCFYSYYTKTGCYWLGTRYKGVGNYGALFVNCDAGYIKLYRQFFAIIVIIFILI